MSDDLFRFNVTIEKASVTGRHVRGFASVVERDGAPVVDSEGDVIAMDDLRKAAHAFITTARVAKAMHKGSQVGEIVESVLIDEEFAKALGVSDTRRGWWIGMDVHDDSIAERVAKGEYRAFSIGGRGVRKEIQS